jgi:hypothetical protein
MPPPVTDGDASTCRPCWHLVTGEYGFYCHKGFNWRVLRKALAARFALESTGGSPLSWLPPGLGSQVWFVLRNSGSGEQNPVPAPT